MTSDNLLIKPSNQHLNFLVAEGRKKLKLQSCPGGIGSFSGEINNTAS